MGVWPWRMHSMAAVRPPKPGVDVSEGNVDERREVYRRR
jgi:hypothetical protein